MVKRKKAATRTPMVGLREWPKGLGDLWKLDDIKEYPKNPRTHPENQITLLAALMVKYGPDQPIVVDDDGIILKGHGRKQAAREAAKTDKRFESFPVVQHFGLSANDKRAVRIADNQTALLSGWDDQLIRLEVGELKLARFDMPLLGFNEAQIFAFSLDVQNGLESANSHWAGMPEFDLKDKTAFKSIVVNFKDQNAMSRFAKVVKQKIGENTRSIWFPEAEIERYADKQYKRK